MTGIQIEISDKTFRSGGRERQAIAGFSLTIADNQFVCLVGPSGCGKTTLLNLIAGLDRDFQGVIHANNGRTGLPNIGYVFQNPRLLPWLTLRQNLELVFSGPPPADLIDSLLAAMQLSDAQHLYPSRLSLGMQRRAAIVRAFAVNPDLLLLDEPFVSLDAANARQIGNLLIELWRSRPHTVLLVSHDLREAIALADRLVFLAAEPMRIVADLAVGLPRDGRRPDVAVEAFRQELLHQHPAVAALL